MNTQDILIKHFSATSRKIAPSLIEELTNKIETKNIGILGWLENLSNKASRAAFFEITGLKLPNTKSGTIKIVLSWVGVIELEWDLMKAKKALQAERDALPRNWTEEYLESWIAALEDRVSAGFTEVTKIGRKTYHFNPVTKTGYCMSDKGYAVWQPYIKAWCEVRRLEREIAKEV